MDNITSLALRDLKVKQEHQDRERGPVPRVPEFLEQEIIDAMSPQVRSAWTLFNEDGLSYNEIVDRLGIPLNTVKSRLHRARKFLKNF